MRQRFLKAAFVALIVGIGSASADVVIESFDVISSDPQENLFATIGQPTVPGLTIEPAVINAELSTPAMVTLSDLKPRSGEWKQSMVAA